MSKLSPFHRFWTRAAAGFAAAAAICAAGALILPSFLSVTDAEKTLTLLRNRAEDIRTAFLRVRADLNRTLDRLPAIPAGDIPAVFQSFENLGLDPETEGIARFDARGRMLAWLGNIADLTDDVSAAHEKHPLLLIVRSGASAHLAVIRPEGDGGSTAGFKLLSFIPRFESPYLREYHFLEPRHRRHVDIDYWDHREDVGGFERIFTRHNDEYLGHPQDRSDIQTLFFPLRNPEGRIAATVTLNSPSPAYRKSAMREDLLLAAFALSAAALAIGLVLLGTTFRIRPGKHPAAVAGIILLIAGLRLLFLAASGLERISALPVFSPAAAGFFSIGALTRSPADIFLTTMAVLGTAAALAFGVRKFPRSSRAVRRRTAATAAVAAAAALSWCFAAVFQNLVVRLVQNSNVHLLDFSLSGSFLLLHGALLAAMAGLLAAAYFAFRLASLLTPDRYSALGFTVGAGAIFFLLQPAGFPPGIVLTLFFLLASVGAAALRTVSIRKNAGTLLVFVLAVFHISLSLNLALDDHSRRLVRNFLTDTIISQERWGRFLVEQTLAEIDKHDNVLREYFRNPRTPDLARGLWEKSPAARLNWYSSLEILGSDLEILSRFSLNVPRVYGAAVTLPGHSEWTVVRRTISFIGKERDFFIAYRDWETDEGLLGRVLLYLSIDPEMLPFLYSANPYFELLRTDTLPSLDAFNFGLAVYDSEGGLMFNPLRSSAGIPPEVLSALALNGEPVWGNFRDKEKPYLGYYFRHNDRIVALTLPLKTFRGHSVDFVKLLVLYLCLLIPAAAGLFLISGKRPSVPTLRSFFHRVYAAFFAVAFIPLLLFTFFTRDLYDRIFSARFTAEAEAQAGFARNIMDDFLFIQEQEDSQFASPSEDLVLWISATLTNDVNLFQDGRLLASSRREFFDAGLLPSLLDGETHHRIVHEKRPFHTTRQKIGDYSFQTLTVPYTFKDISYFISLPFPFEGREADKAAQELIEFVVFLSIFFAALVVLFARGIRTMIISPLRKLLAATHEVSLGNLEVAVEHGSRDEMMTLIEGFNAMIRSLKEHQQELTDMGRKVAWAEMARKVAHEIKNPLTPIQLSAEHLLRVYEDKRGDFGKALQESVSYIIGEVENLRRIAQEFMDLSRDMTLQIETFDLGELLDETIRPYARLLEGRIRFRRHPSGPAGVPTRADPSKIKMAVRNVLINAIESISGAGEVDVRVFVKDDISVAEIRDSGIGMDEKTLEKIFVPYFSMKASGTGLGLAIVKKILEDHGGRVHVFSRPGLGTTVTLEIPRPES
jgi:signal transduction histidine kinase